MSSAGDASTYTFRLPDVGEGLGEAEILSWRAAPGEHVARDQVLVEIQTDKSVVDIPCPVDGVVRRLGAAEGETLAVGAVLAELDADERAAAEDAPPADRAPATAPRDAAEEAPSQRTASPHRRVRASPAARKHALARGIALADVPASGPGGRVTRADVERYATTRPAAAEPAAAATGEPTSGRDDRPDRAHGPGPLAEDEVVPLRGLRREIARTMTASAAIPTIYEWRDVDATGLSETREVLDRHRDADAAPITLLALTVKAVAATVGRHPRFNATFDPDAETLTRRGRCNVGVATATAEGLVVPVIHDADQRTPAELAAEIARLAAAARDRRISVEETRQGTVTVSNFGSVGARYGAPLIRPPEVAIVGLGRVHDGVVAADGRPAVRPLLPLVVGTDHRINDGDHLAAFCDTLETYLADPRALLAELR